MPRDSDDSVIKSGIKELDDLIQGMRLGDNVVWQVDNLDDYALFAESFVDQSIRDGFNCIYIRFAAHKPVLKPRFGLTIVNISPSSGFGVFSTTLNHIIDENGKRVCYVFDNLSDLVSEWATDELLANFFQFTCAYLAELKTVAYFSIARNRHAASTIARIRDTTQVLLDLYRIENKSYIQPLKVWDRYSSEMFIPHEISDTDWQPIFRSGEAAKLSISASNTSLGILSDSIAPWDSVYTKLVQYRDDAESPEVRREVIALQRELTRMMIGNHPDFNKLADRYLNTNDLIQIRSRMIGSGRIGGKAAGMLVARKVLSQESGGIDFASLLEEHDSFYIGSDVFFTFLVNNNLFRLKSQLSRNPQISREEFQLVEQQFLDGQFSSDMIAKFKSLLEYFGQAPIIVRSSSLLEDNYGNAFAGKYRSEFCANQGNPDKRLESFLRAVKLVYASALNPDALIYRKKRGLDEGDEQMALLVQRVSGTHYHKYFFPSLAGVAFSRNLYAWTTRIDPLRGMIRLVFGLGTRAVNRIGGDYPRMISLSHPGLRPEFGMQISRYSQRNIDLLDLEANEFVTRPVQEILALRDYPNLIYLISTITEDMVDDAMYVPLDVSAQNLVLTFNNLIKKTNLVNIMSEMLAVLERAWGQPVDIEFTAMIDINEEIRINLLQCRPLRLPRIPEGSTTLPEHLDASNVLFKTDRIVTGGIVETIRYVIYIDPRKYAGIKSYKRKYDLGMVVGKLNQYFRGKVGKVMAVGPGRWGSSDIDLGVNVRYADIDNISVLVEVGHGDAGNDPEWSYGTHFFQDLIEGDIVYLPVFPNKAATSFNRKFFNGSPSILAEILPDYSDFDDVIQVIDVPAAYHGVYVNVIADAQTRKAISYLK